MNQEELEEALEKARATIIVGRITMGCLLFSVCVLGLSLYNTKAVLYQCLGIPL